MAMSATKRTVGWSSGSHICLPVEQVQARAGDRDVVRRARPWRYTRHDGATERRVSVRGGRVRITQLP
jgi:hypothetical protein